MVCPDDWHLHLRDGVLLQRTVADTAAGFARAVIMPNLQPPITTVTGAQAYRQRVLAAVPEGLEFTPLMTLYLHDDIPSAEIRRAAADDAVFAAKLYPAGITTGAEHGVRDIRALYPVFATMQETDLPLLIHGETRDPEVDVFDRERLFLERELVGLRRDFPALRIVLEHISTRESVDFVSAADDRLAATITAHHLNYDRNALLGEGIRPHYYCLPVLKRAEHREALVRAATSGDPHFFAGTDSAPHERQTKESACGCAGCYTAPLAMPLYAEVFESASALPRLEAFCAFHGADFYGLPRNTARLQLLRQTWNVPERLPTAAGDLVPLAAGSSLRWRSRRL